MYHHTGTDLSSSKSSRFSLPLLSDEEADLLMESTQILRLVENAFCARLAR